MTRKGKEKKGGRQTTEDHGKGATSEPEEGRKGWADLLVNGRHSSTPLNRNTDAQGGNQRDQGDQRGVLWVNLPLGPQQLKEKRVGKEKKAKPLSLVLLLSFFPHLLEDMESDPDDDLPGTLSSPSPAPFQGKMTDNEYDDGENGDSEDDLLRPALPLFDEMDGPSEDGDEGADSLQDGQDNAGGRGDPGRITMTNKHGKVKKAKDRRPHPSSSSPTGPPRTGAEYLLMVRREAASFPAVVVAKPKPLSNPAASAPAAAATPTEGLQGSPPRHPLFEGLSSNSAQLRVPAHLQPSPDWTKSFLLTFASLRLQLDTISQGQKAEAASGNARQHIPKLENEGAWRKFCLGSSEGTPGTPPATSLVSTLTQRQTMRLLEYHTRWLNSGATLPQQLQWIFSLLLRIDKVPKRSFFYFSFLLFFFFFSFCFVDSQTLSTTTIASDRRLHRCAEIAVSEMP